MSDNVLKQQFQLLQEQKKKRLIKKNEINKSELEKHNNDEQLPNDGFNLLNQDDDLNLHIGVGGNLIQDIKETDDYKDLLETVRELRDENGRLDKLLAEKEEEIRIVRRRWKAEKEELAGGGIGSENAASKIIEFSKKIRELTTIAEKEKLKSQNLQKKIDMLRIDSLDVKLPPTKEEKDAVESELSTTKERLNHALLKSAEGRNEIDALKKELKIAQKVLAMEVGENVTFHSLLKGSSGWRGRQQQILALQLKVTELQQQMDSRNQSNGSKISSRNALLSGMSQHDEKHRLSMRKIEIDRKEQQDKLQKELGSTMSERDSYKEKNNAARVRNKILSQDIKSVKEQLTTMIDKGKHDDELVSALLREQEYLKKENGRLKDDLAKQSSNQGERVLKASGNFSIERSENDALVSKLKDNIKIQEERVKQLENEIDRLKSAKSIRQNPSLIPRPQSSRNERSLRSDNGTSYQEKESIDLQLEECRSLCEAAKVEKEKLGELVQVLQRRNEELIKQSLEKELLLSEFRNTNVQLQKRIEKLSLYGNNTQFRGTSSVKKGNNKTFNKDLEALQYELDETNTKLSIEMDSNEALKDALDNAMQTKMDDLKAFHEMIEQTKQIFLHGLRQYRQKQDNNI